MTADSSTVTVSGDNGAGVNSPSGRRTLTSPWSQVVRGVIEPDSVPTSPAREISDPATVVEAPPPPIESQPESCNAGDVKKPAWNKLPANGVVEAITTPVMGADLWPALSESTRSGMKSVFNSSESSSKPTSDFSAAFSHAPVISQPPPKQHKPNANNVHQRQKQMRRVGNAGGVSASYNRPPPPPPLPPPFPFFDVYGNLVPQPPPPVLESPQPPFKGNNWIPRSVDPSLNRNLARRNNFGPRPVNNGGRRDHHDRDWRGPRSHQMGPPPPPPPPLRGFIRGPVPFIPHQPIRPFGAPMGYDMGASYVYVPTLAQEPYRGGAPHLPHGPPGSIYTHPSLRGKILQQIEYYFSDANLVKDNYLKSQMDEEGWVPITLIAGFPRVQMLTIYIQMIMNSLTDSSIVEVQGDKVRRRNDWRKWLYTSSQSPSESTNKDIEEASLQKLTLEDGRTNEKVVSDSPKLANGEVSSEDLYS